MVPKPPPCDHLRRVTMTSVRLRSGVGSSCAPKRVNHRRKTLRADSRGMRPKVTTDAAHGARGCAAVQHAPVAHRTT